MLSFLLSVAMAFLLLSVPLLMNRVANRIGICRRDVSGQVVVMTMIFQFVGVRVFFLSTFNL